MTATTVADALLIPKGFKEGATQLERIASVNRVAYPLLGVDPASGEHAWIRTHPISGKLFVTKDGNDTLAFPHDHPMSGRPRYRWVDGDGGIQLGYLTAEATEDNKFTHA